MFKRSCVCSLIGPVHLTVEVLVWLDVWNIICNRLRARYWKKTGSVSCFGDVVTLKEPHSKLWALVLCSEIRPNEQVDSFLSKVSIFDKVCSKAAEKIFILHIKTSEHREMMQKQEGRAEVESHTHVPDLVMCVSVDLLRAHYFENVFPWKINKW